MDPISSSSPPYTPHRRARSHSSTPTSSPVPRHSDLYRPAPKRIQPAQLTRNECSSYHIRSYQVNSQPPAKWDVEMWRRGKRARRDPSVAEPHSASSPTPGTHHSHVLSKSFSAATPSLPSTSDAFNLFPKQEPQTLQTPQSAVHAPIPTVSRSRSPSQPNPYQSHSDAFVDLRRSVEENGEGFVRRMREWEERRSRSGLSSERPIRKASKRGRKRASPIYTRTPDDENPDDGNVDIFATAPAEPSPAKKRAVSLGRIDLQLVVQPQALPFANELDQEFDRSSSPVDFSGSCPSAYSSDDDDMEAASDDRQHSHFPFHGVSILSSTPPLSFTFTNSANSSLVSLPLSAVSHPHTNRSLPKSPRGGPQPATYAPTLAFRSERAVAALSLALANGAGSVSDYGATRSMALEQPSMEDYYVGDLWA
ncbi:hypothetical protein BD410DRAFT_780900 [Rickenella mellea]|uniref:Uncharacterized protein n=1 Tax=Rickenella mellea TaxID=50990 RepID=A0A4Y7QMX4_9AGAM|nr:hypothetical protein BD410DRAFT_780900 [Rickenella mellea]